MEACLLGDILCVCAVEFYWNTALKAGYPTSTPPPPTSNPPLDFTQRQHLCDAAVISPTYGNLETAASNQTVLRT